MKKRGKLFPIVMIFAMFMSLLAGCGDSTGGQSNGNEPSDEASNAKKDEVVTLKMIESLTSPKRTEVIKGLLAKFEEQNPNIKVELISPPLQTADNKIATMLQAKEELDVLEVRDLTVSQFVTNGFIEDLSKYTEQWSDYEGLNQNAKAMATDVQGKPYYIPSGLYQRQLFYRKDWFDEKGLKPPKTWEELYEVGKQLTDPSKNRYGYSFRGGAGSDGYITAILQAYNGSNVNPKDAMFNTDGSTIFSTPAAKDALNLYVKIYNDISPKDSLNWSYPEMVEGFVSGVTAMLIQDPEVVDVCKEKMKEGTWATAPLPTGPNGQALFGVGAGGWGMTSYSKHKEEAWKLISFLSSPEQNLEFTKKVGLIPIHKSAADDEFFKTGYYAPYIEMNNDPEHFIAVKPATNYKQFAKWPKVALADGQALILGRLSVEDALKKWDELWKSIKTSG